VQQRLGHLAAATGTAPGGRRLPLPLPAGLEALARRLEQERTRWLLWLPVMLGAGIAGFFALPGEPPLWAGWLAAAAGLLLLVLARRLERGALSARGALLVGLATLLLGAALAQARLHAVAAPVLRQARTFMVDGRVADLAPLPQGDRFLLDQARLEGVPPERTPATIRVSIRRAPEGLATGDRIRLRARLQPPLPPAMPGAFDFARQAWFERLGAIGFALGAAERIPGRTEGPMLAVAGLRARIADRIAESSPGAAGAVGAAILVGVTAGIDQETWRAMQVSGLAHLLSVSGLHMALVAGSVFAACRWLLALVPAIALRFPVKKIAALVALPAAFFYLLLTGMSVPTQRSFLMSAVALVAIVADRNPFSLRLLAWAALVVLVVAPESVMGASFQLSFAAVLALIVAYEALGRRPPAEDRTPRRLAGLWRYLGGVCLTTLIASAATTPFAAFYFQTIPTYGVLANLVAVPLTSFVVMPAGLLGLALMPLGWDQPLFALMAFGVKGVLLTARTVGGLPGASILVQAWPSAALVLLAAGGLWLALWQERWRWLGLAPCAVATVLVALSRPPDLLVDATLGMAAIRHGDGVVTVLEWDRDRLVRSTWLRRFGVAVTEPAPAAGAGPARGIACDPFGCTVELAGRRVTLARHPEAVLEDCGRVELVVARVGPERCSRDGAVLGPRALARSGGIAISANADGLAVETVAERRGDWPWVLR
jgi:competence protein ComEC